MASHRCKKTFHLRAFGFALLWGGGIPVSPVSSHIRSIRIPRSPSQKVFADPTIVQPLLFPSDCFTLCLAALLPPPQNLLQVSNLSRSSLHLAHPLSPPLGIELHEGSDLAWLVPWGVLNT